MKSYKEIKISYKKSDYEKLCNFLYNENINLFLEENNFIKIYFTKNEYRKFQSLLNILIHSCIISKKDVSISDFNDIDWQRRWEDSIELINIKDKIIIYPSWKANEIKNHYDKILIQIEPKMSFGTGQDITTQLMLEMMCNFITGEENTMLDYGCGTSILSIAGIKLGIKKATAIDIDEDSIRDAKEVVKLNKLVKEIKIIKTDLYNLKEKGFDVISANINAEIISKNLYLMKKKLANYGKLFLTGITYTEGNNFQDKIEKLGLKLLKKYKKNDWLGFYITL